MKIVVYIMFCFLCIGVSAQDKNVYILENGNIGIGTQSPSQKLEIDGNANVKGNLNVEKNIQISGNLNTVGTIKVDGRDMLPVGSIVMWTSPKLPNDNWKICDGQNGTINLVDRFVVGEGSRNDNPDKIFNDYKQNFYFKTSGGTSKVALTSGNLPAHTHQVWLTDYDRGWCQAWGDGAGHTVINADNINYYTDNDGSGYNIDKMQGKPMDNLPPYYTVYFIMKIK
jgi:hypothetical protein